MMWVDGVIAYYELEIKYSEYTKVHYSYIQLLDSTSAAKRFSH